MAVVKSAIQLKIESADDTMVVGNADQQWWWDGLQRSGWAPAMWHADNLSLNTQKTKELIGD